MDLSFAGSATDRRIISLIDISSDVPTRPNQRDAHAKIAATTTFANIATGIGRMTRRFVCLSVALCFLVFLRNIRVIQIVIISNIALESSICRLVGTGAYEFVILPIMA